MFFSFDGIDGVGKSTQIEQFVEFLGSAGHDVVTCRDPGSTELGEAVRRILLEDMKTPISPTSEMFLYMVARTQMVTEVIAPALASGKVVVSDRFLLSNVVYQGYAGGLTPESVWQTGKLAIDGMRPTLTFVLDMDPREATKRLNRPLDRMEQRGTKYRQRLRDGFLAEAQANPREIVIIHAAQPIDAVQKEIQNAAAAVLR